MSCVGKVKEEVEVERSEWEEGRWSLEKVKEEEKQCDESEAEQAASSAVGVSKFETIEEMIENFPCSRCEKVFESAFVRWEHMRSAHQTSHRCSLCNEEFATKEEVRRHKFLEPNCKRRLKIPKDCPTCGRRYTVMRDYYRHVQERCRKRPALTGVGRFQCSECGLVLHLERLLKAHRAFKHPKSISPSD
uniref:C2H2-type domain-containing protein n=1 Tax=Plectus sambesii TaxID=2011161 RepID=A0A914V4I0_9BILA